MKLISFNSHLTIKNSLLAIKYLVCFSIFELSTERRIFSRKIKNEKEKLKDQMIKIQLVRIYKIDIEMTFFQLLEIVFNFSN